MRASGFMSVPDVNRLSNRNLVIVVCSVLMGRLLVLQGKLMLSTVVAVGKSLYKPGWLAGTTLFAASTTLVCCALPILLVSLGLGAVVANIFYQVPAILFLAEYKNWTLLLSLLFLLILAWVIWRPNQACPANPDLAEVCRKARRWNKRAFWLSVTLWGTSVFFSYLILPLMRLTE